MMTLALVLATQAAPPPPVVEYDQEIVVLGRKLDAMYADVRRDAKGRLSCELNRTSGNRFLDNALCAAATECVRDGAYDSLSGRTCIDRRKPAMLAAVRERMAKRARR